MGSLSSPEGIPVVTRKLKKETIQDPGVRLGCIHVSMTFCKYAGCGRETACRIDPRERHGFQVDLAGSAPHAGPWDECDEFCFHGVFKETW